MPLRLAVAPKRLLRLAMVDARVVTRLLRLPRARLLPRLRLPPPKLANA
jgi:hypothetical protein